MHSPYQKQNDTIEVNDLLWQHLINNGATFLPDRSILVFVNTSDSQYYLKKARKIGTNELRVKECENYNASNVSVSSLVELCRIYLHIESDSTFEKLQNDYDNVTKHFLNSFAVFKQSSHYYLDHFGIKENLFVLKCDPVCQGLVGQKTEVIFTRAVENKIKIECEESVMAKHRAITETDEKFVDCFISNLMDSHLNELMLVKKKFEFKAEIFRKRLNFNDLLLFNKELKTVDLDNVVKISYLNLVKVGCRNGSWVNLEIDCDGLLSSRAVIIYAEEKFPDEKVGFSPMLYFNLNLHENSLVTIRNFDEISEGEDVFAAKVFIAQVPTPFDTATDSLKEFLETENKFVRRGDILCVPETMSLSENSTLALYKITSVLNAEGKEISGFINSSTTQVVQQGIAYSKVPLHTREYFNMDIIHSTQDTETFKLLNKIFKSSYNKIYQEKRNIPTTILISGKQRSGKLNLIMNLINVNQFNFCNFDCMKILFDLDKNYKNIRNYLEEKLNNVAGPLVIILKNLEAFGKSFGNDEQEGQESVMSSILQSIIENASINAREFSRYPVIVVATSLDVEKLSSGLQSCFQHHFIIKPPNELERTIVLENLLKSTRLSPDISLKYLATQTAAFGVGDLVDLVANAGTNAVLRIKSELDGLMHEETIVKCGCELSSDDFIKALDVARLKIKDSIGAPKIPSVEWEDIGGLSHVKNDIADTIQLPLLHPELFTIGMKKRSGVLLYGPPGTGKTLVAKAVATTFSLNFLSVKGPELLNMYIGESEQNVRNLFQKAREAQPCVLFFDELDSLAPKRGEKGDSGGVMDRIVSQLLAELDQVGDSGKGVFIIGATNRPELLDSALLRPGRFDKLIYLGVSKDHVAQLKILEALTRKFKLSPDLVLSEIANKCPFNYTGADFYALCSDAMLKAMLRVTKQIDAKIDQLNEMDHIEGYTYPITADFYTSFIDSNVQVIIEKVDFETALQELVPSVSIMELKRYEKQREIFEGTFVKSK